LEPATGEEVLTYMNGKIASEKDSIFGPDGYEDTPQDMVEAFAAAVFIEDNFPSPEELKRELKRTITIRLDPDVYSWFQLPGAGYQTRINAVLRAYMKSMQTREKSGPTSRSTKVAAKKPPRPTKKSVTTVSRARRVSKKTTG